MHNPVFPPPPAVKVETLDGAEVEMTPLLINGVLEAFCWKADVESAVDLYCAETPSRWVH